MKYNPFHPLLAGISDALLHGGAWNPGGESTENPSKNTHTFELQHRKYVGKGVILEGAAGAGRRKREKGEQVYAVNCTNGSFSCCFQSSSSTGTSTLLSATQYIHSIGDASRACTQATNLTIRSPQILGYSIEGMESKLAFLMQVRACTAPVLQLRVTLRAAGLQAVSSLLAYHASLTASFWSRSQPIRTHTCSLNEQALDASREEARDVVVKYPQVLNLSMDKNLRLKIDFFTKELQGLPEDVRGAIVGSPSILGYSLAKRIKPRVEVIRLVGVEPKFNQHIWLVSSYAELSFSKWVEKCLIRNVGADGRGDAEVRRRMKACRAIWQA